MGLDNKVRVKPTRNTSWDALKNQREKANVMYLFTKIDLLEVITCHLQDLEAQGYDIFGFSLDWLPEKPTNFLKRKKEPPQKTIV